MKPIWLPFGVVLSYCIVIEILMQSTFFGIKKDVPYEGDGNGTDDPGYYVCIYKGTSLM
jgi:hypothetical protein